MRNVESASRSLSMSMRITKWQNRLPSAWRIALPRWHHDADRLHARRSLLRLARRLIGVCCALERNRIWQAGSFRSGFHTARQHADDVILFLRQLARLSGYGFLTHWCRSILPRLTSGPGGDPIPQHGYNDAKSHRHHPSGQTTSRLDDFRVILQPHHHIALHSYGFIHRPVHHRQGRRRGCFCWRRRRRDAWSRVGKHRLLTSGRRGLRWLAGCSCCCSGRCSGIHQQRPAFQHAVSCTAGRYLQHHCLTALRAGARARHRRHLHLGGLFTVGADETNDRHESEPATTFPHHHPQARRRFFTITMRRGLICEVPGRIGPHKAP